MDRAARYRDDEMGMHQWERDHAAAWSPESDDPELLALIEMGFARAKPDPWPAADGQFAPGARSDARPGAHSSGHQRFDWGDR